MTAPVRRVPDVVYREVPGYRPLGLDLYLPEALPTGPVPVIVHVHGGGWRRGSRRHPLPALGTDFYDRLAAQGFAVAAVDYRLSGEARYPAALEDVRAAVDWARDNVASYGLDTSRVFAWGDSAGGHLVLMAALTGAKVQAVVAWFPVTDLAGLPADVAAAGGTPDPGPESREALFLGAPASSVPDLAREASPVTHASAGTPPVLLMHGEADTMVPAAQSIRLAEALRAAGSIVELELVPGATHFWDGASDITAIVQRSIEFLRARLARRPSAERARDPLRRGEHGQPDAAWLRAMVRQQDAERGHHRLVLTVDRRGHRHHRLGVLSLLAPVDGQPFPPNLGQGAAQDRGRDQHIVRLPVDRLGQQVLLHLARGEGEQDQAESGGVQRQPAADPVLDRCRLVSRQPLDQRGLAAVADAQLDVLPRDLGQIPHERQRHLAQAVPARCQRRHLQQPQPDAVASSLVPLQRSPADQTCGQAQGRAHRHAAAAAELGQGQPAPPGVECGQQRQRAVHHRLTFRRPLATHEGTAFIFHWVA